MTLDRLGSFKYSMVQSLPLNLPGDTCLRATILAFHQSPFFVAAFLVAENVVVTLVVSWRQW